MLGHFLLQHLVRLQSLKAYICLVYWCIHRFGGKFKYQTSQFERTDSSRKSVLKLWRVCQSENVKNSQDLHFKAAKGATGKSNKMVIFVRKKERNLGKVSISSLGLQHWWRTGALVQWLKEETHFQKVMSSNPSTRYWMDIFHINFYCLFERSNNKRKRVRGWSI